MRKIGKNIKSAIFYNEFGQVVIQFGKFDDIHPRLRIGENVDGRPIIVFAKKFVVKPLVSLALSFEGAASYHVTHIFVAAESGRKRKRRYN